MSDLIDRQAAIDAVRATLLSWSYMPEWRDNKIIEAVEQLPPIQPEPHEIGYKECANALLKMWMDNVLTDGEYHRIADKLNEKCGKTELPEPYKGVTE